MNSHRSRQHTKQYIFDMVTVLPFMPRIVPPNQCTRWLLLVSIRSANKVAHNSLGWVSIVLPKRCRDFLNSIRAQCTLTWTNVYSFRKDVLEILNIILCIIYMLFSKTPRRRHERFYDGQCSVLFACASVIGWARPAPMIDWHHVRAQCTLITTQRRSYVCTHCTHSAAGRRPDWYDKFDYKLPACSLSVCAFTQSLYKFAPSRT